MNIARRQFVKLLGAAGTALTSLKALGDGSEKLLPSVTYSAFESNATGYLRLRVSTGGYLGATSHDFVGLMPNEDLSYDFIYALPLIVIVDEGRTVIDAADFCLTAADFSFQLYNFEAIADMRSHEHLEYLAKAMRLPPLYTMPIPKVNYMPLSVPKGDSVTIMWASNGLMTVG